MRQRVVLSIVVMVALFAVGRPAMAQPHAGSAFELRDGVTAPIFDYATATRERVWVPIPADADHDGKRDRVALDIVRPGEPYARGQQAPVVMNASPYNGSLRGHPARSKVYDKNGGFLADADFLDNYFVPRGYGFVSLDTSGTGSATGRADNGGRLDVASVIAAIDWLNDRTQGFTSKDGTVPAITGWSTVRSA